jgi:microcystin-dependent protein
MALNAWLTPDAATGFICRRLLIPDGLDWLGIVTGALNELIYAYNFEQDGTQTPDQTAAAFQIMFDQFCLDQDQECRMIGEIITFANDVSPNTNWLSCDGSSVLRTDYPDLFTVIGTTFGSLDGTHFSLPDLQGRVPIGDGSGSGLTPRALGDSFGEETHVLTTTELASHTHIDSGHAHTEGTAIASIGAAITGVPVPSAVPSVGVTGSGNASLTTTGSDAAHNNMQPSLALHYFIVAL